MAYCLDGGWSNPRAQNLPKTDIADIIKEATVAGLFCSRVGKPKTLRESIEVMSECSLFASIDSGLAHLAIAMGIEPYIINPLITDRYHRFIYGNKKVKRVTHVRSFIREVLKTGGWKSA
jgi:ADP-heptose:LPS heptosyltransferase